MTEKQNRASQDNAASAESTLLPMLLVGLALMAVGMFVVIYFV